MSVVILENVSKEVIIPSGYPTSEPFYFGSYSKGIFTVPPAWTSAKVGFKVCATRNGAYSPLKNASNANVEYTVSTECSYPFPTELQGAIWVIFWSENNGSNVLQLGDRSLHVNLKG